MSEAMPAAGRGAAAERTKAGVKQRDRLSRADLGKLRAKARDFDPVEVLLASAVGRLARLLPVKYVRMAASPFAFFRGAVAIMAADLGRLPHSGIPVQLCGDAHVQNLGSFAAPDGRLVFDFNDFDESIRGPWEWDVKRMAASIVLAGREAGHKRADSQGAALAFADRYCAAMAAFAREPVLQVARHQIHREHSVEPVSAALRQSARATPLDLLKKLTEKDGSGRLRFRDLGPVSWRLRGDLAKQALAALGPYEETLRPESRRLFSLLVPIDVGFKVVGTGSVGLRDYVVLLEGNGPTDPLFLQIKQEMPSAYARFLPEAVYEHQGRRAAEGQRAVQPVSDLLLGWTSLGEHHFVVRQLNDHKGSIDIARLRGNGLESLAELAGELMARGHARSGDACAIHGYCGGGTKLQGAIRAFAVRYADQAEADYEQFLAAIKKKKIPVAESAAS